MDRDEFMAFFRDDERLETLSPDDRVEVFRSILLGSSDITEDLLKEVIENYGVTHLKVVSVEQEENTQGLKTTNRWLAAVLQNTEDALKLATFLCTLADKDNEEFKRQIRILEERNEVQRRIIDSQTYTVSRLHQLLNNK